MRHYTVYMISKIADRDCRHSHIPAESATAARAQALDMMARPDVWLVVRTRRES